MPLERRGSSAPGVPAVRRAGASSPPRKVMGPAGWRTPPGHGVQPFREMSEAVHHEKKACIGCRAGFFRLLFVSKCQPFSVLPVKRKTCPFPPKTNQQIKKVSVLLPPARTGQRSIGRGCLRGVAARVPGVGLSGEWDVAALRRLHPTMLRVLEWVSADLLFLIEFEFYFERGDGPAGSEARGEERVPALLVTRERGCVEAGQGPVPRGPIAP